MTLGEIIVKYRLEHGLSQRQFALRCGLSNGYIAMIEKNRNPATGKPIAVGLPQLKSIAAVMGLSADELMRQADGNTPVSMDGENSHVQTDDEIRILSNGFEKMPISDKQKLKAFLGEFFPEYFNDFTRKGTDEK